MDLRVWLGSILYTFGLVGIITMAGIGWLLINTPNSGHWIDTWFERHPNARARAERFELWLKQFKWLDKI